MQLLGRLARRCGLRRAPLGLAQLAYGCGEDSKAPHQRAGWEDATRVPGDGDEPRRRAQPITVARTAGDLAIGRAGRPS